MGGLFMEIFPDIFMQENLLKRLAVKGVIAAYGKGKVVVVQFVRLALQTDTAHDFINIRPLSQIKFFA